MKNHTWYRYLLYKNYCKLNKYKGKNKLLYFISMYKYSKVSLKLNVQINSKEFISNFYFEHCNIVVNRHSILGDGIRCIGNNCIGGNDKGAPKIGNNVEIGYGAIIIGDVTIANDCKVGAGAIVTKDVLIPGSIVIGMNIIK